MLHINQKAKEKLKKFDFNNMYIISDFDKTITVGNSKTSWSILASSNLVPAEYKDERDALYKKYRPIEIDDKIDDKTKNDLIKEWFQKHINLFVKYQITEEIVKSAAKNISVMEFRKGAKEFLSFMNKQNIPFIICSAGIGNFAKAFLAANDSNYDNIYISSNIIKFENGIASGVENNIIHSLNKNEVSLPDDIKDKIKDKTSILLLGDQASDKKMIDESKSENTIYVGFTTEDTDVSSYLNEFDIVVDNQSDYFDLLEIIKANY